MTITDVKVDIKNKTIKPYYIFTGEEIEVQRIYINKIAEILGLSVVHADSIAGVWGSIITPSILDTPCVYVVRDDKDLIQDEGLNEQLNTIEFNGNVVIFILTAVDKRTKWYKTNKDRVVLFEHLPTATLVKYCQRDTELNKQNCEDLIDICENDYSRILLEIDKITHYKEFYYSHGSYEPVTDDVAFEELIKDGTIAVPPKDAIFDLVEAILKRQTSRVYALLDQCRQVNEANMVILSVLFTNTKQVLQVQACKSSDIAKSTGLTVWQIKCAKDKLDYYSNGELVNILRLIQKVQKGIITGEIEDGISVDYLLVNIL